MLKPAEQVAFRENLTTLSKERGALIDQTYATIQKLDVVDAIRAWAGISGLKISEAEIKKALANPEDHARILEDVAFDAAVRVGLNMVDGDAAKMIAAKNTKDRQGLIDDYKKQIESEEAAARADSGLPLGKY